MRYITSYSVRSLTPRMDSVSTIICISFPPSSSVNLRLTAYWRLKRDSNSRSLAWQANILDQLNYWVISHLHTYYTKNFNFCQNLIFVQSIPLDLRYRYILYLPTSIPFLFKTTRFSKSKPVEVLRDTIVLNFYSAPQ